MVKIWPYLKYVIFTSVKVHGIGLRIQVKEAIPTSCRATKYFKSVKVHGFGPTTCCIAVYERQAEQQCEQCEQCEQGEPNDIDDVKRT